jgi:hypothetical protein
MALWTPARTTTALWLDGADASTLYDATSGGSLVAADGAVARWEDKSGNLRHATQGTLGSRPLRKVAIENGLDSPQFNGTSHWMACDSLAPLLDGNDTAFSLFFVAKSSSSATIQTAFSIGQTSDIYFFHEAGLDDRTAPKVTRSTRRGISFADTYIAAGSIPVTNTVLVSHLFTGTNVSVWKDGNIDVNEVNYNAGDFATNPNVGAIGALRRTSVINYWPGTISELVVILGSVTTQIRQQIEGSLCHKWGLAGNLPNDHPYKTNAPKYGLGGIAAAIAEII